MSRCFDETCSYRRCRASGFHLREPLAKLADTLVSSDLADDVGQLFPGETYAKADLTQLAAMVSLPEGADMVVHFGAYGDEAPFKTIVGPNIVAAYNVREAAYRNGVHRVVYASVRELSETVAFMISDAPSNVTSQNLRVDGGLTMSG